jgi:methionine-rich copper-binding protein CopC
MISAKRTSGETIHRYYLGNRWPSFLFVLLVLGLTVAAASAHTPEIIRSEPGEGSALEQSPAQVKIWLNEELQTKESLLQIFDAEGHQVDQGDGGVDLTDPDHASMVVSLPTLPDGPYTVRWRVALGDGDATEGEWVFTIGQARAEGIASLPSSADGEGDVSITWVAAGVSFVLLLVAVIGLIWHKRPALDG